MVRKYDVLPSPKLNRDHDEGRRALQRIARPESLAHLCQHFRTPHRCTRASGTHYYYRGHGKPNITAKLEGGMALHRHRVPNSYWNLGASAFQNPPGTMRLIPCSIRYWIGILRQDHLTEAIRSMLSTSGTPNFSLVSLEPQLKEGGLFVRYRYQDFDHDGTAVKVIEEQLRAGLADQGGIPSWANLGRSDIWVVKGNPWREVWAFWSRTWFFTHLDVFRT